MMIIDQNLLELVEIVGHVFVKHINLENLVDKISYFILNENEYDEML
jgi:hypothetical protein